jgi:hypothetical protein
MPPSRGEKKRVASVWRCTVCRVQIVVAGHPNRVKHPLCGKYLDFVREIQPAPAPRREAWPYPSRP